MARPVCSIAARPQLSLHNATPEDRIEAIAALRRLQLTGPEIAEVLEMATSTVSAVLKRIGLGKLSRLEPTEPIRRYEKQRPGELIHIDVKKLGRIEGGAGHRITGRAARQPISQRRSRRSSQDRRLRVRPRLRRRLPPGSPTSRFSPTRRQRPRSAF